MTGRDQRRFEREPFDGTVEIFFNGYAIEFLARDISISGIGIDSLGVGHLTSGSQCIVSLSQDVEVPALVVGRTTETVHLRFSEDTKFDIQDFMERSRRVREEF